jgi:precorrin-2/cobalt-factor-2 C20-methyltransferase
MSYGTFYGVGVGPGAADLLTIRAANVLNSVDVIAIPRPSPYASSVAWRSAEPNLTGAKPQERLFLTFPMTKDPSVLVPAWEEACEAIVSRLTAGRSVAFITQGDPMVFSTFIYLRENVQRRLPELPVNIVSGVTSISAVPAACGIPLADGQERVAIVPATYGVDDLRKILRDFDSIVLMKVSSKMAEIVAALEAEGLLDQATYVERATGAEERIVRDVASLRGDRCVYFSMILVHKRGRSGVLRHGDKEQCHA